MHKVEDNRLETYRQICAAVTAEQSSECKTAVLRKFFEDGVDRGGFKGDLLLWVQMLLRHNDPQRNIKLSKPQMLKYFARLFDCSEHELVKDFELELDVAETLRKFFAASKKLTPQSKSTLYLQDVDRFLQKLEVPTSEAEQFQTIKDFCQKLTALDLKTVITLATKRPRSRLTVREVLDAIAVMAYPTYLSKRNLEEVVLDFGGELIRNSRDRIMNTKKYTKYWTFCGFILTVIFFYTALLGIRELIMEF